MLRNMYFVSRNELWMTEKHNHQITVKNDSVLIKMWFNYGRVISRRRIFQAEKGQYIVTRPHLTKRQQWS